MNIGETINLLKKLRHEFIDDLPQNELKSGDANYEKYKCRSAFFGLVSEILIDIAEAKILEDPQSKKVMEKYEKYRACGCIHKRTNHLGLNFRTKTDIRYVNVVLDFIIKQLSAVLNSDSTSR